MKAKMLAEHLLAPLLCVVLTGCNVDSVRVLMGEEFDFGPIFPEETSKLTHTFKVKNTSTKSLSITGIEKSCTCTKAEIDKRKLIPGETADLILEVDTRKVANQWRVSCTLTTDHPVQTEWTYALTYRTYMQMKFADDLLVLSGNSNKSVDRKTQLEIYRKTQDPKDSIKEVISGNSIDAIVEKDSLTQLVENGQVIKESYNILVRLRETRKVVNGQQTERLQVLSALGKSAGTVISWNEAGGISIDPPKIFLNARKTEHQKKKVSITMKNNNKMQVKNLLFDSSVIAVKVLNDNSMLGCALEISANDSKDETKFRSGEIRVITEDKSTPEIVIPWTMLK